MTPITKCRKSRVIGTSISRVLGILMVPFAIIALSGGCNAQPTPQQNSDNSGEFGAPVGSAAPQSDGAAGAGDSAAREIEEADVVKVLGDKVYALNRYKGLFIISVSNPDVPTILGNLDLRGRGVEMYVVGTQVFAVLSADYYFPYIEGGPVPLDARADIAPIPPEFDGSQLAIINVTNPASPTLQGKINLAGYANDSRRVGNIIYVVGRTLVPYTYDAMQGDTHIDEGFVASINVADPANILPVERETFAGEGLEMHVSETLLLAASRVYDPNSGDSVTRVQAVDISDPAGAIVKRDDVDVPGYIRNRFYMDDFNGVMRIATESWGFGFRKVRVFTYDLANLDNIAALGQVEVIQGETLEAVRFDGPRGYIVTFLQVDPLFVINLSDPSAPTVAGQLEVPGFSTHIEPRGNRLIAVGIDDTDGRRPAVAYYNVEDPANPSQLSRVVLGPPGSFTESEAVYDEKAFKVVDELGLIAIPFQHVNDTMVTEENSNEVASTSYVPPSCTSAVQLVDFSDAGLTQRGWFEHDGNVERVGVVGSRVFSFSQVGFQTVDISNRDTPSKLGEIEFLPADEMARLAIGDCGYGIGWPVDPGFGMPGGTDFLSFLGGMCGAFSITPLLFTAAMLLAAPRSRSRSR